MKRVTEVQSETTHINDALSVGAVHFLLDSPLHDLGQRYCTAKLLLPCPKCAPQTTVAEEKFLFLQGDKADEASPFLGRNRAGKVE